MLKETKKIETTVETEIALDECGGHVMLTLKYDGDKFCQALTAKDMGKIIAVCNLYMETVVCCEGDLTVNYVSSGHQGVEFVWHSNGRVCKVVLETTDILAFECACRSYCRQLFRTNKGV